MGIASPLFALHNENCFPTLFPLSNGNRPPTLFDLHNEIAFDTFLQQKGIPKNCRNAKISGRCPIFPKPNASHFYSVKRSSVFYAKIGPRLSPKLFAVRDSSQSVNCGRELFPAPPKIVCRAGFLAACGLQSGIIGRHAPPKIVCRAGFPDGLWITVGDYRPPRSPEDCLPAGFLAACGLLSGIIGRHAPRR